MFAEFGLLLLLSFAAAAVLSSPPKPSNFNPPLISLPPTFFTESTIFLKKSVMAVTMGNKPS